jgi:hypothetical protein
MKLASTSAALTALVAALSLPACNLSGHGGDNMSAAECKAVLEKGYQLQETPAEIYAPLIDAAAKDCSDANALSRKDYECGMKSTTLQEYQDCKIVLDFS